jgi:hypothetical protein
VFNLPHPPAAKAIKDRYPDAKIVILLREMIARAWSSYRFQRSKGAEWAVTFEAAIDEELSGKRSGYIYPWRHILCSQYGDQVERYLRTFGDKNVHIASFDDLIKDPDTSLAQLSTFLSIAPFPHVRQLQSNKTFGEPAGPLAARMSELIYTPNLTKTIVRSFLPRSLRGACSDSIKRAIPRKSYNGYISGEVLEQLENLFDRDDERVYHLTGLKLRPSR